jgi:hypothetical protein
VNSTARESPQGDALDLALGLLLYGSTLYFASNALLLPALGLLVLRARLSWRDSHVVLVWLFALAAMANVLLHLDRFDPVEHSSALAVVLVAVSATLAPSIAPRSFKVFVVLTCAEVLVGAFEYATGTVALTAGQAARAGQDLSLDSELLYDLRVFGLSANSSLLAEKVFISLALILAVPGLFRSRRWPLALLAAGLFLSFNRTAILCTALLSLLYVLSGQLRPGRMLLLALLIGAGALAAVQFWDELLLQVTRGSIDELSYSELSRLYFWERSFEVVSANPLFGNGSLTFRIDDPVTGIPQHAHNSLAMLLATHGLIAPAFLLAYVVLRIGGHNWRPLLGFAAFSMTQYFVFWNLSVPDLVMFWLLGRQVMPTGAALEPQLKPA